MCVAKKKGKDKEEPPEFVPAEVLAAVQGWNGSVQELLSLSEQVRLGLSTSNFPSKSKLQRKYQRPRVIMY